MEAEECEGREGGPEGREGGRANGEKESVSIAGRDTEAAARVFSRVLTKSHLKRLVVLGQFNLGFIIARIGADVFILDQHACDEKYNFETLQSTTTLHEQRLIAPKPLELSAMEEVVILEHLPTFKANGFSFRVDPEAGPMERIKLLSLPYSKGIQFGLQDIHELASLLGDSSFCGGVEEGAEGPAPSVRLPKIRAMFASRACRMSIMIGKALTRSQVGRGAWAEPLLGRRRKGGGGRTWWS
ncbi:dna mismatch repair protein pms2 [Nannochloropsis gaditana]|uniref:Dna mismatch repair protein pms2 n=1 Tax=Nannochloropsis gaditana TaxID=72520 RepID=W7T5L7_9STRA|nr:dna mismatch repair protein pms2 [Nannochloropsis gaditana]